MGLGKTPVGTVNARQAVYLGALILIAMSEAIRWATRIRVDFMQRLGMVLWLSQQQ